MQSNIQNSHPLPWAWVQLRWGTENWKPVSVMAWGCICAYGVKNVRTTIMAVSALNIFWHSGETFL